MAEYGYEYRIFSAYITGTVRNETREPVIIKPFVPSLPKSNDNKEGHGTRKTIVPITSSSFYDDSATEKYPSRGGDDDNQWHRHYGGNKEGRKPVGSTIRKNDNHDGYNNGTNGYGSDCGGNKERAKPVASTIRNGDYGTNGYGGDYGSNKEGRKQPIGGNIRKNDNHGGFKGTNNNGFAGDKGGRNKKDNYDHHEYDGTNRYSDDDDHYYQSSMRMEPALPNKGGNYGSETDDHDRKGPLRTFPNFNPSSRPPAPIIDSTNAMKIYNGTRV